MRDFFFQLFSGIFLLLCLSFSASGQFPEGISYQAIARDSLGNPFVNALVEIRSSILEGSFTGAIAWQEEYQTNTDDFGLFSLVIGEGISTGVGSAIDFASINWGGMYHFLQIEMKLAGNWTIMGTTQLMSVPYALHAKTAENVDDADAIVGNELITLLQLVGTDLNVVEGANAFVVDLSTLQDDGDWTDSGNTLSTVKLVGIGTSTPTSCMDVQGSISYAIESIKGPLALDLNETHHVLIADLTLGNVALNLPSATTCKGRVYRVKLYEAVALGNQVNLNPYLGETIDGYTTYSVSYNTQDTPVSIISDGANWWVLSQNTP